jgi:hypothetical protein
VPKKFASLAAPFPLQADAFSCHDSPDFNRNSMQMTNSQALFEDSVNAQGLFSAGFAIHSLVAKSDNHSYCWGALKEKRTCSCKQIAKLHAAKPRSVTNTNRSQHASPL